MIGYMRSLIRREVEAILGDVVTEVVVKNNKKIEADLIAMGVLERREDGELHAAIARESIALEAGKAT